jgi:NADPH-dependent 2,4-dienoyl-CoA reductase/sulfur reductase-like enzyme
MKAIIVGGGYTGIMMCEPLRNMGLEVTVLEKTERILGTADVEITQILENEIKNKGVKLVKGVSVERFVGHEGSVTEVVTDKGRFDTDLVLIAIGTRPNVELAKRAGINVGVNGAIKVDKYMRTNISGVYAAGDCAEMLQFITKKNACNCLGIGTNRQGRIAGENAAGMRNEFKGVVNTTIVDVFGLKVARTGLSAIDAECNGYDYFASATIGKSICRAHPDGIPITMSCTVDRTTGRFLGAGILGQGGVKQRIDTLATCIYAKMTIKDVNNLELACMPPFAEGPDPILVAADEALRKWRH